MPNSNPAVNHVNLMTMISRCLSGDWLIDGQWLLRHADLVMAQESRPGDGQQNERPVISRLIAPDGQAAKGESAAAEKGSLLGQVSVLGTIYKYGNYYSYGSKDYVNVLAAMARDERVGGVKLVIDSPGGQASGTREFYEVVKNYPKPLLVCVDGYMASAAYYLGCGAARIVATQPTDQIGSIGTYRTYADFEAFYASMGLKLYEVYAPGSTEKNEDYRQIVGSEGKNRALAEQSVAYLNNQFIADVRAGRGDRLNAQAGDPMKGRLYYADEAVSLGLIDEVLPEDDTMPLLAEMIVTNQRNSISMSVLDSLKGWIKQQEQGGETQAAAQTEPGQDTLATLATLTTERDQATAQVTSLTGANKTLTEQVATLTKERDEARAERDAFGEHPGATPTRVTKKADAVPAEQKEMTLDQEIESYESTQRAREEGLW